MAYCLLTRTGDGKQSVCHKSLGHRRQTVESDPRFRHRGSETGYPRHVVLARTSSSFRGGRESRSCNSFLLVFSHADRPSSSARHLSSLPHLG